MSNPSYEMYVSFYEFLRHPGHVLALSDKENRKSEESRELTRARPQKANKAEGEQVLGTITRYRCQKGEIRSSKGEFLRRSGILKSEEWGTFFLVFPLCTGKYLC